MSLLPVLRSLAERFAAIVEMVCRHVVEREHRHPPDAPPRLTRMEVVLLIRQRLSRIRCRFETLLARFKAGDLRSLPTGGRRKATGARPVRAPRPPPDGAAPMLPRSFGWLREIVPECGIAETVLNELAGEDEIKELIAAAPDATRRVLGPLYWMLGMHMPPELRAPFKPGTKERSLPMMPSVRRGLAAGWKLHAAYLREQAAAAAAGIPPPPPPLPYGISRDPEHFTSPPTRFTDGIRIAKG